MFSLFFLSRLSPQLHPLYVFAAVKSLPAEGFTVFIKLGNQQMRARRGRRTRIVMRESPTMYLLNYKFVVMAGNWWIEYSKTGYRHFIYQTSRKCT
jgi:hypothetical protein